MFGSNLRELATQYPSISELARQLGINRTQFNRYLAGESFPRPDVLARICDFFEVDARVLLEPVSTLGTSGSLLAGPILQEFLGSSETPSDAIFPNGFYGFSRKSYIDADRFALGLVYVWRDGDGPPPSGPQYGDTGTYSRFFLIPKASRSDREPWSTPGRPRTSVAEWRPESSPSPAASTPTSRTPSSSTKG